MRWNLENIYSDFDSEDFKNDERELDNIFNKIKKWKVVNNKDEANLAEEFIALLKDYLSVHSKLIAYSRLKVSVDAKDEKALKAGERLEKKISDLTRPRIRFQLWLKELDNRKKLYDKSNLLKEHRFIIEEYVDNSDYLLSEDEEDIISKMKQTGSSAWTKLQQNLSSTLMVDIEMEGEKKKLPLPVVRNLANHKDFEIRKKAYMAELAAYQKIEDGVAAALNGIKGEVLTLCEKRGYKSPLEKILLDSRMDDETLNAMLSAIEDYLPVFHKYYRKKAEVLAYDDALPFYELFAPLGKKEMKYSYEEARDFIITNISSVSKEMAKFYKKVFNEKWIDSEPRNGKRGGAFCYNIHEINESRILSNFTGSLSDVITLAHELGHAYHGYCLDDESLLNSDYPMPLAETASIFSETVVTEAAINEADSEQLVTILENKISQAGQVIVDIYSRFLFEKSLFEQRKEGSLSIKKLKKLMLEAQKKAYGEGLNHKFLHPYMWLNKPHYYSANYNYYNFPYAFGLLFGLGVYSLREEKREEFMDSYNNLLRETGKNKIFDLANMMGINVHSSEFWSSSLRLIEKDINKFINII